jgi:formylmethanofuran dehydrogenase subunit D
MRFSCNIKEAKPQSGQIYVQRSLAANCVHTPLADKTIIPLFLKHGYSFTSSASLPLRIRDITD